jgi:ribonuclease HII
MKNAVKLDSFKQDESASRVSLFDDLYVTELGIDYEQQAVRNGYRLIAGVDEVGRGCIAGPVVAAACILDLSKPLPEGLNDSKKLSAETRERITLELKEHCIAYAIGEIDASEIDRINILEATKQAMLIAIGALQPAADYVLIDALHLKQCSLPQKGIIKGDSLSASIAAASILAKTYRDALMCEYHEQFPQYGFDSHKGYGAPIHWKGLNEHGPCAIHRMSFHGVVPDVLPTEPLLAN